jgi:leucyl/phenylalanyl-tRNA--protein transferase
MRIEPPRSDWRFPGPARFDPDDDLVAAGADLAPGTLLEAYRRGLFPMPSGRRGEPMLWFSPVRRGVLPLDGLRVSRSLRRSVRRFEIRVDTAVPEVVDACADPRRPAGWIDSSIRAAYVELHRLGWVHSVEAWRDGRLAGGLYGVSIGGLFAGESMFHRETDASKVALVALVELLREDGGGTGEPRLLDVQWQTPHLASLGVVQISRREYLGRLPDAVAAGVPRAFR